MGVLHLHQLSDLLGRDGPRAVNGFPLADGDPARARSSRASATSRRASPTGPATGAGRGSGSTGATRLWTGVVQHLELVGIAIGIGFVIAFAAALLAYRFHAFETPIGLLTAFLYTVPSIAAFEILLPITGITWTTVLIPLVAYTLLILFRNILAGLRGVPVEAMEAARGMGLTDRQMLWRVQLPLALPAIVTGIRIAVVTTISLATSPRSSTRSGSESRSSTGSRTTSTPSSWPPAAWHPAGPAGRLPARRRAAPGDAVGPGAEGVVIPLADSTFGFGTFPRALEFVGDHGHLIGQKIWEHLQLSGVALLVSLLIGLPLGIVLGHLHRGSFIAINVSTSAAPCRASP